MTAPPPNANPIPGDIHQWEHPDWAPILALVGPELAGWFMWMGEIRLDDGTMLHAFKHRDTRRYCHLTVDGRAYDYVCEPPAAPGDEEIDAYRPITRLEAIDEAFRRWSKAYLSLADVSRTTAWLDGARLVAGRGDMLDVDPRDLELQRQFEEERRDKAA